MNFTVSARDVITHVTPVCPITTLMSLSVPQPFGGSGQRLDGKKKKAAGKGKASSGTDKGAVSQATHRRGIPHYDYKVGKLKFFSAKSLEAVVKKREEEKKAEVRRPEKCASCVTAV